MTPLTVGYGDIVPVHSLSRGLSYMEAALGLLALSLAVTYLLSVYPIIARKAALATALNQETAGRADGVAAVQRYLAVGRFDALADRLRWLNDELLVLGEAHSLYPILFYVRPRVVHESFVRVLALTQGLVATLRYGVDPGAHPEVPNDPRLQMLEEGLLYTLHNLERSSHIATRPIQSAPAALDEHFASLRIALDTETSGAATNLAARRAGYERFRTATDPYIRASAATVHYDPGEVWATYGRWSRDSALVPRDPTSTRTTPRPAASDQAAKASTANG